MLTRLLLAAGFLLVTAPAVLAGGPALLGATLSTTSAWVEVESLATVPTTVELSITEGTFRLAETSFSLEPGERHRVTFTGEGRGMVAARMTAEGAAGDSGAVVLSAWLNHTPAVPSSPSPPLALFLLLALAMLAALPLLHRRRMRRDRI